MSFGSTLHEQLLYIQCNTLMEVHAWIQKDSENGLDMNTV